MDFLGKTDSVLQEPGLLVTWFRVRYIFSETFHRRYKWPASIGYRLIYFISSLISTERNLIDSFCIESIKIKLEKMRNSTKTLHKKVCKNRANISKKIRKATCRRFVLLELWDNLRPWFVWKLNILSQNYLRL